MSCLPNSCCSPVQCIVWQLWSLHHVPVVFGIVAALLCNTLPHPPTRPYRLLQKVTQSGIDRTVSARICHTLALVWDSRLSAIRWLPRLYLTEANVLFFYVDPRYTSPHLNLSPTCHTALRLSTPLSAYGTTHQSIQQDVRRWSQLGYYRWYRSTP